MDNLYRPNFNLNLPSDEKSKRWEQIDIPFQVDRMEPTEERIYDVYAKGREETNPSRICGVSIVKQKVNTKARLAPAKAAICKVFPYLIVLIVYN